MNDKKTYQPDESQPERDKTPAELKAEKFAANPDQFEDLADVLISIKLNKDGKPMMMNNCKNFEQAAVAKLTFERNINRMLDAIEVAAIKEHQRLHPQPSFMNGLRNGLKRK